MANLVKIFMERDDLSKKEAVAQVKELQDMVFQILANGGSYDEVETLLLDYDLEMDYIEELVA